MQQQVGGWSERAKRCVHTYVDYGESRAQAHWFADEFATVLPDEIADLTGYERYQRSVGMEEWG